MQGDDVCGVGEGAVEGIRESAREERGKQVDVELKVPRRIHAVNHQSSTMAIGGTLEIESDGPDSRAIVRRGRRRFGLVPTE